MPNKNYQRGSWLERRILKPLKEQGFNGFRSAGSHSPVDVIVWSNLCLYCIQCKHTLKKDIDLTSLLSDDSIHELEQMIVPGNTIKVLCIKQGRSNSILQLRWNMEQSKWKLETVFNI